MALKDDILVAHHTAVCVTDFQRALNFYINFLGFELEGEMDERNEPELSYVVGLPNVVIRWAMLKKNTYRVELFKYYAPVGDSVARRQCDLGYNHMAFEVADVDSVYKQAKEKGYKTVSSPQNLRGGRTRVFYLCEPEGAITEFVEFKKIK